MTLLRHYDNDGAVRFITFSCYRRYPIFSEVRSIELLIEQVKRLRADYGVRILGYVIMPDHVHLVLWPPRGIQLGVLIGQVKGRSGRKIILNWEQKIPEQLAVPWRAERQYQVFQRRCYDHNCRSVREVSEKIEYCHKNPIVRGLVQSAEDWEWSSCRWYAGMRDVPLEIDDKVF
jgi:putative transposase